MTFFEEGPQIMKWASCFGLYGLLLDLVSTLSCEALYWPICVESNRLLMDVNGHYLPQVAVLLAAVSSMSLAIPLAVAFKIAFKRWSIASLPIWYLGVQFADAGTANLLLIVRIAIAEVFKI